MADFSLADVSALMDRDRDDGFGGVGWIILLFIFIWAVFGGGYGFGGRNGGNALTQAELQAGLYNQTTDRNLSEIRSEICSNAKDAAACCCATQKGILESQYSTLMGFKDSQLQLSQCCCENRLAVAMQTNELKSAILEDGQRTREILVSNQIQELRDKLQDANTIISNQVQTQNILSQLGRYVTNPSVPLCAGFYGPFAATTTCGNV